MKQRKRLLPALAAGLALLASCEIPPLLTSPDYVDPEARITLATEDLPGAAGRYETGAPLAFDASASVEGDSEIASYAWDFGDGSPEATGVDTVHTYGTSGTYTVTLTVGDTGGQINEDSLTIIINRPPSAVIQPGDLTVGYGEEALLDGSGSSDGDGSLLTYQWDSDDGTVGTDSAFSPAYSADGTYTVTLTVTDDQGTTDSASVTVTVTPPPNRAPEADAGDDQTLTYDASHRVISLDGSGSADSDGTLASVLWTFISLPAASSLSDSDITGRDSLSPSFDITGESGAAAAEGSLTYELELTVTDEDGAADTDSVTITITGTGSAVIGIE
jgi:PKD repeat protein